MDDDSDKSQLAAKNGQPVWAYEVEDGVFFHLFKGEDAWRVGRDMKSKIALSFFKYGADFMAPTGEVKLTSGKETRGWSLFNHRKGKWAIDWTAQATCVAGPASDTAEGGHDEL